jgi:transcriptional regulator with XRE-family HTH domain
MSIIRDRRTSVGWSQADLARALRITPSAVSQMEKRDDDGTITVRTLRSALEVMGAPISAQLGGKADLRPVSWDYETPILLPDPKPDNALRAAIRAASRVRNAGIEGDILCEGVDITSEQAWLIADHVTIAAPLHEVQRARAIASSYDRVTSAVRNRRFVPTIELPHGQVSTFEPHLRHRPTDILVWMAECIRTGAVPYEARHVANGLLVENGLGWIVLSPYDKDYYRDAINRIQGVGDAKPLFRLLVARYSEED